MTPISFSRWCARPGVSLAILLLAAAISTRAQEPDATGRSEAPALAVAWRAAGAVVLDGRLDEAVWQKAPSIGPLAQVEPRQGAEASHPTDVRLLFDDQALYIGIACEESHSGALVSTQLARDADLEADDGITVVIDPFFDHRNGFFFQVNPSGARSDGQISNNSFRMSRDWDGIWDAAVERNPTGWTAEVRIPFKTLRFKPGQTVWGFNVERQIKHLSETDRWASPRVSSWITNMADAGRLTGLAGAQQGRGLDVRPYVSGGRDTGAGQFDAGLDVFKNLTPNMNASVTVNTDFAETEADSRQINLTRFPLFYPEKRTFFLEGAGVFDVAGLGGSDLIPFFTRRIGLHGDSDTGGEVPIAVGTKLVGRQSDFNVGVLDVQTRALTEASLSSQNLLAARVSRNLFKQSWIGAIVTRGNPDGTGDNTLLGVDARLATSTFRGNRNLTMNVFVQRTQDATAGNDYAGGVTVMYPNDRWDGFLSWKQIGDRFDPALGFVPRTGIRKSNGRFAYQPRPRRWGIRQLFFEANVDHITNLANRVENWRLFLAPFNARMDSGEHFEFNVIPEFEHLDAPFEIFSGMTIPAGSYQWQRYRAQANTATKRRIVLDATYWWGSFYDGTRRQVGLGLTVKPNAHLSILLRGDRNDIALKAGRFYTQLVTGRIDFSASPNVSWMNLAQYDNESRLLSVQSRFRWILKPGNDLFLVLNRGWVKDGEGTYQSSFDRAASKLQYTFRF